MDEAPGNWTTKAGRRSAPRVRAAMTTPSQRERFAVPEQFRVRSGALASSRTDGNNGAFMIPGPIGRELWVVASDGDGWEHVSVSLVGRLNMTPSWPEMCFVKDMFWSEAAVVVQYHPARSDHVNHHPGCLHLWRPIGVTLPTPDPEMVGPSEAR